MTIFRLVAVSYGSGLSSALWSVAIADSTKRIVIEDQLQPFITSILANSDGLFHKSKLSSIMPDVSVWFQECDSCVPPTVLTTRLPGS
ncbi:hypothetical protein AVEN_100718-1 [Araneus ventricosus]|uniref:Uncharacterized protein n=1 Tax=Araneus ventricosus TaxID=182803 RepID=A0A4Y2CTS4_ARAVE|nr:hypothetical protein AVEN_100718-1 [Araneus ventricosus]